MSDELVTERDGNVLVLRLNRRRRSRAEDYS
jgi:hypothetical protein